MANPLAEAAVQAIEIDAFSKDIPNMMYDSDTLYRLFKEKATVIPVSNITGGGGVTRPSFRVNMRIQAGAAITQGTGNGDSLGRGTGSQWAGMALSPVFFYSGCEITYLARMATNGPKRSEGGFKVQAQELKNSLTQAEQGLEGLMNSDGSGTFDQIPATATVSSGSGTGAQTSYISGMNVAVQFADQQVVQFFPSIGGAARGSATISYVDGVSNTLYFSTVLPSSGGATAVGDYVVINGGSGAAGSSLMGLRAYQVNSNTGSLNGLPRASFPGRLSTPTINMGGQAIVQATETRVSTLIGRALGPESEALKDLIYYCGPDQAAAIQNTYYNVQYINRADVKGEKTPDMAQKFFPDTWGGRDLHVSWNALPGRIDGFCPSTWYLGEMIPLELYDFGSGVTVAPVVDINTGGYLTSNIFYYNACLNLVNSNVRAGCYITNAAIPAIS